MPAFCWDAVLMLRETHTTFFPDSFLSNIVISSNKNKNSSPCLHRKRVLHEENTNLEKELLKFTIVYFCTWIFFWFVWFFGLFWHNLLSDKQLLQCCLWCLRGILIVVVFKIMCHGKVCTNTSRKGLCLLVCFSVSNMLVVDWKVFFSISKKKKKIPFVN